MAHRGRWGSRAALVALVAISAACGGDDGSVTSGASTVPSGAATDVPPGSSLPASPITPATSASATSTAEVSTSVDVTEPPAAPVNVGVPLADWVAAQEEAGREQSDVVTDTSTGARLLVAFGANAPADVAGGLLLADGQVIDLPTAISRVHWPFLAALGGRPVIVAEVDGTYSLWQLSSDAATWSDPVELGVFAALQGLPYIEVLGDRLVVANQSVQDVGNGFFEPDRFEGVLVSDDLDVVPMAEPPARQFLSVTSTVGAHALMLGLDSAADVNAPLRQPWDFDASTNEWEEVPIPEWLGCGTACNWTAPHEFGDRHLEVVVGDRVVKRLPDGSIGVYEPDTRRWTRVEDAPFDLAGPTVVVLGDQIAVAPVHTGYGANRPGTVGVLDLGAGTWSTDLVDVGVIPEFGYQMWEGRGDGTIALFDVIHPQQDPPAPSAPDVVYDSRTREWRTPTSDEAARWAQLVEGAPYTTGPTRDLLSLVPSL